VYTYIILKLLSVFSKSKLNPEIQNPN